MKKFFKKAQDDFYKCFDYIPINQTNLKIQIFKELIPQTYKLGLSTILTLSIELLTETHRPFFISIILYCICQDPETTFEIIEKDIPELINKFTADTLITSLGIEQTLQSLKILKDKVNSNNSALVTKVNEIIIFCEKEQNKCRLREDYLLDESHSNSVLNDQNSFTFNEISESLSDIPLSTQINTNDI